MFLNNQTNNEENTDVRIQSEMERQENFENVTDISRGLESQIDYPILNFFGGSVRTDRVEHENSSRRAGLARWFFASKKFE